MADEEGEGDFGLLGKASDFEPDDWKKKFELIEINPVTGKPRFGEYVRVATTIEPTCNPRTLERRFKAKDTSATKVGAPCALGALEPLLLEWLKDYKSLGVDIYRAGSRTRPGSWPTRLASKASESWLNGFCQSATSSIFARASSWRLCERACCSATHRACQSATLACPRAAT